MKPMLDALAKSFRNTLVGLGATLVFKPITLEVNPVPASRPRVTRWGAYYGKNYTAWRKEAEKLIEESKTQTDKPLAVTVEHFVHRPKTTKRVSPRGDIDNYLKAPLDAITSHGKHWKDDDQIVAELSIKRFVEPEETPKTVVYIYEI